MRFPLPASPSSPGARAAVPQTVATPPAGAIPALRGAARAAMVLVAAGGLAGCSKPDAFAPACPQLGLYADGADLIRYNGRGRDLTDLVVEAHLVAVPASCRWADDTHKQVEAMVRVSMTVNRGPVMPGRTIDVPYFIAVAEGNTIRDKQVFNGRVDFPANTDRLTLTSSEITLLFPVTAEKSAAAYKIWVSFQLTPEELATNRNRPAR